MEGGVLPWRLLYDHDEAHAAEDALGLHTDLDWYRKERQRAKFSDTEGTEN